MSSLGHTLIRPWTQDFVVTCEEIVDVAWWIDDESKVLQVTTETVDNELPPAAMYTANTHMAACDDH